MADLNDAVAAAILEQNNAAFSVINRVITLVKHGDLTVYADHMEAPDKGVIINKIDADTAASLASIFITEANTQKSVPLVYALACSDIESIFDPAARNGNFLGSNPTKSSLGFDLGVCQLKVRYLIGQESICKADQGWWFALDPNEAIPYFYRAYAGLLEWATAQQKYAASAWNPRASNIYYLATCGYNFGRSGAMKLIQNGDDVSHGDKVADLCHYFSKQLNLPDPMEGL